MNHEMSTDAGPTLAHAGGDPNGSGGGVLDPVDVPGLGARIQAFGFAPDSRATFGPGLAGFNPDAKSVRLGTMTLENGQVLPDVIMTFQTWGKLNADASNAILVEHALTGDSHVVGEPGPGQPTSGWWPDLIGPGAPLDTSSDFIVAINVLGGCRGSTGPVSLRGDGSVWAGDFPQVSVRDQVNAEAAVADAMGIRRFKAVIGGSMGGMRVTEWIASYPGRVSSALVVASCARAPGDQIAWGHAQISAIEADPAYRGGDYLRDGPRPDVGLGIARMIAHATYRSSAEFEARFGRRPQTEQSVLNGGQFAVDSYLDHHGAKLAARFDAVSYVRLTQAMATHDVGRGRGGLTAALRGYDGSLIVAAVDSDRLFPVTSSIDLVRAYGRGRLRTIHSRYGHDGFLIEADQIASLVRECVRRPHEGGGQSAA